MESSTKIQCRSFSRTETGASVAEFAVAASFFFMMIFGIIEFGRLLYTHNALTDAARRGARYAVLNPESALDCVKMVVVYGEKHVDKDADGVCSPQADVSPLIKDLDPTKVDVVYEGAAPNSYGTNLGSATVTINNFDFLLGIPLFTVTVNLPSYSTTLTAESAGNEPPDI